MSLKNFITSRTFLRHFLYSVGLTLAVILFALLVLRFYTRHGQAIPVPDVTGMTLEQAEEALDDADLYLQVVDSTYNENFIPGGVVDQVPDGGHKVKRHRTVFITLNAISPEEVAVPKLTDISHRQAVAQLESAGLLPGTISYEPSEFQNLVLKATQNGKVLKEGEMIHKGTVVDLVLGSGQSGGLVNLPDLRGMNLADARTILGGTSLPLGSVFFDETIIAAADSLTARIFRQHPNPAYTFEVTPGSAIDVWLTLNPDKIPAKKTEETEDFNF